MLPPEKFIVAMGAVRDQLLAVIDAHERDDHQGAMCIANRASAIGLLAHSLDVRDEAWDYAEELLAKYDAEYPDRNCKHGGDFPP